MLSLNHKLCMLFFVALTIETQERSYVRSFLSLGVLQ